MCFYETKHLFIRKIKIPVDEREGYLGKYPMKIPVDVREGVLGEHNGSGAARAAPLDRR